MTKIKLRVAMLPNLALATMLLAGTAHAQTTADEAPPPSDEIVVTATKRSENLQSVRSRSRRSAAMPCPSRASPRSMIW